MSNSRVISDHGRALTVAAATVTGVVAVYSVCSFTTSSSSSGSSPSFVSRLYTSSKFHVESQLRSWILKLYRFDEKLAVLLPDEEDGDDDNGSCPAAPEEKDDDKGATNNNERNTFVLLMIYPGAFLGCQDYVAFAKEVQRQVARKNSIETPMKLVVGIGTCSFFFPNLLKWALHNNDPRVLARFILEKAEKRVREKYPEQDTEGGGGGGELQSQAASAAPPIFKDIFLFGHSLGGGEAAEAAYPSSIRGLLLYGSLLSFPTIKTLNSPPFMLNKLLASYPRPVLTLLGDRDGFVRYYKVAAEAQELTQEIKRQIQSNSGTPRNEDDLERAARLKKPIIIMPELNHMHMATGEVTASAKATGRSDFPSRIQTLSQAHATLTSVVVDFLQVHATAAAVSSSPSSVQESQDRLIQLGKITQATYLDTFNRLSERATLSRFIHETQRKLLHVTTVAGVNKHNFYEDEHAEASEHHTEDGLAITSNWHSEAQDFLYSKPTWDPDHHQLWIEIVEQKPLCASVPPQVSKTLAFKGKTQEAILYDQPAGKEHYQEIKDSPVPTLMELNQATFDMVLNKIVNPQQRLRYLKEGKRLKFGPDIFVVSAPKWVETPISITKHDHNEENSDSDNKDSSSPSSSRSSYYLLQSPYVSTPLSYGPLFGGMWYGKPLSPAQAYEWIVFDAFKP
jgi:hypothetical protein